MYSIDKKKCMAALLYLSSMGYVISATLPIPYLDPDLDLSRPEILVEKEVRLLEKDLGTGVWVSEEDMILLTVMVREHLSMMPYNDLQTNPTFVRSEAGKVMVTFVAKRAEQFASQVTADPVRIANARRIESNEFMGLLQKNPLREGSKLYPYFGAPFQSRVYDNVMRGRKY